MVLETTIKVSKKLRDELKEELHYGESYNDMIVEMISRLKGDGWRYYEA
ncbi:MAG: hypothetical protein HOB51_06155 [Thaumarchaeota archaeon]|nr:hypothetical protein [Nitrososphaerota archaeon]